jgi:hypothetical protein
MRGSARQGAPSSEDVFADGRSMKAPARGPRSSDSGPSTRRTVEWEDEERQPRPDADNRSRTSGYSTRVGESVGPPAPQPHLHSDPPRAPTVLIAERDTKGIGRGISSRPATSMADFFHGESNSRSGAYSIRSRRTIYDLSDRPVPLSYHDLITHCTRWPRRYLHHDLRCPRRVHVHSHCTTWNNASHFTSLHASSFHLIFALTGSPTVYGAFAGMSFTNSQIPLIVHHAVLRLRGRCCYVWFVLLLSNVSRSCCRQSRQYMTSQTSTASYPSFLVRLARPASSSGFSYWGASSPSRISSLRVSSVPLH